MAAAALLKDLEKIIRETAGPVIAEKMREGRRKALADDKQGGGEPSEDPRFAHARRSFKDQKSYAKMSLDEIDALPNTGEFAKVEDRGGGLRERGMLAGRCVRYLFANGNDVFRAMEMAKAMGETALVEAWEKALGTDSLSAGGAIIPPEFASGIIALLSAKAVVRALGATIVPMNTGSITLPFIATGATAAYVGQNANITASQPTFGQLHLSDKKLAALVPTSNDLLRNGGAQADRVIRDDIVRAHRLKEDLTFLRSDGSAGEPKGALSWAQNTLAANGTVNVQNVTDDLGQIVRLLEDDDVDLDGAGWAFAPRTKQYLMTARDGNGNLVWEPELKNGTLMSYPFAITSQIPTNLGGGTDESEIYFAGWPSTIIAENETMMIQAFDGGAYHDGSAVVSGISQDQTVMRSIALHDYGARQRGTEIGTITAVKWAS